MVALLRSLSLRRRFILPTLTMGALGLLLIPAWSRRAARLSRPVATFRLQPDDAARDLAAERRPAVVAPAPVA